MDDAYTQIRDMLSDMREISKERHEWIIGYLDEIKEKQSTMERNWSDVNTALAIVKQQESLHYFECPHGASIKTVDKELKTVDRDLRILNTTFAGFKEKIEKKIEKIEQTTDEINILKKYPKLAIILITAIFFIIFVAIGNFLNNQAVNRALEVFKDQQKSINIENKANDILNNK